MAKAKVLSNLGLIVCIMFIFSAFRLYTHGQTLKTFFILSVVMFVVSIGFHLFMKKAMNVLGDNPSDEEILKWGNFLELYYVPKYFIRKAENSFIIEDEKD